MSATVINRILGWRKTWIGEGTDGDADEGVFAPLFGVKHACAAARAEPEREFGAMVTDANVVGCRAEDLVGCDEARQRRKDAARTSLTGKAMANADPQGLSLNFNAQLAAGTSGCSRTHCAPPRALSVLPGSAPARLLRQLGPGNRPAAPRPRRPFAAKSQLWQLGRSCSLAGAADPFMAKSPAAVPRLGRLRKIGRGTFRRGSKLWHVRTSRRSFGPARGKSAAPGPGMTRDREPSWRASAGKRVGTARPKRAQVSDDTSLAIADRRAATPTGAPGHWLAGALGWLIRIRAWSSTPVPSAGVVLDPRTVD